MFGPPECPVEAWMAEWLKGRLGWLVGKFGAERVMTGAVITPTPRYFPHRLDSDDNVRRTFELICGYMGVNPGEVVLELTDGEATRDWLKDKPHEWSSDAPGGTWDNEATHRICISRDTFADPMHFVAVAAHELCHELLLGKGLVTGDEDDHEPLTDVATVFFGMGIFGANSCLHFRQTDGLAMTGHEWGRSGYLELDDWAYALALYSFARGEAKPDWLGQLRGDVRSTFKLAVKYIKHARDGLNL